MKAVHLSAEEKAQLCDEGVPLPAIVWGALWVAVWLTALLYGPGGPGPS